MSKSRNVVKSREAVDLIFKHLHKDYRANINGVKSMLYPAPKGGLGPIADLDDAEFAKQFEYAELKEVKHAVAVKLLPIMDKYGLRDAFLSTEQWRDSLLDVVTFASFSLEPATLEQFESDVKTAGIQFPGVE